LKNIALVDVIIMESELALSWNDKEESYVSFQLLRDNCPCAFCSGEKDVFGNIYKGPKKKLQESAYKLKRVERVGHYAIRIFWGDNHVDGLFTYDMLRNLGNS
tara:strand:+ start:219 stop:527 length:309 start_codon:yes stop_codon:yes gene_type:complete